MEKPKASGDFYIAEDECLVHHTCIGHADTLLASREDGPVYFVKQPETRAEFDGLFAAIKQCPMECFYYIGDDPEIKAKMSRDGVESEHRKEMSLYDKSL